MKRFWLASLLVSVFFCATAFADEAGVLTETELSTWLNKLLLSTANVEPLNAPVGEDALTEDGYAFIYNTANALLQQACAGCPEHSQGGGCDRRRAGHAAFDPAGVARIHASDCLWLANPTLAGDDNFAPLYVLNQLPASRLLGVGTAHGDSLQSVQLRHPCARRRGSLHRYGDSVHRAGRCG